jgi:hypothetical protein
MSTPKTLKWNLRKGVLCECGKRPKKVCVPRDDTPEVSPLLRQHLIIRTIFTISARAELVNWRASIVVSGCLRILRRLRLKVFGTEGPSQKAPSE